MSDDLLLCCEYIPDDIYKIINTYVIEIEKSTYLENMYNNHYMYNNFIQFVLNSINIELNFHKIHSTFSEFLNFECNSDSNDITFYNIDTVSDICKKYVKAIPNIFYQKYNIQAHIFETKLYDYLQSYVEGWAVLQIPMSLILIARKCYDLDTYDTKKICYTYCMPGYVY